MQPSGFDSDEILRKLHPNPNQDMSPATVSVLPVPAVRARTDPKAFLPSLSKKQRGRNWFKQQSVAVLQDCQFVMANQR